MLRFIGKTVLLIVFLMGSQMDLAQLAAQDRGSAYPLFANPSPRPIARLARLEADQESQGQGTDEKLAPAKQGHYPLNWKVYRDRNPYPVDPRKPCHPCVEPPEVRPVTRLALPGLNGRPYKESEIGGCPCGKRHGVTKLPNFSPYWPSVTNAALEEHFPKLAAKAASNYCKPKFNDWLNGLGTFKLIDYKRCDPVKDPYGCLGESQHFSRVFGVGFRQPGQPIDRGFHFPR